MAASGIDVVLHGARLRWTDEAGRVHELRRTDLEPVFGAVTDPRGDRFVSAEVRGERAVVRTSAGAEDVIDLDPAPPDPRRVDVLVRGARVMTCNGAGSPDEQLGLIDDGAVAIGSGVVRWLGPAGELPRSGLSLASARTIDAGGRLCTPGLVDCHAHPIFAGDRAGEFAMRAGGKSYRDIAEAGGGIAATLVPTRAASVDELIELAWGRMQRALAAGTTTCEAKSGYDLTVAGELRLLEVARAVDALSGVDVSPTLLGAHVVPPERRGERDTYIREVAEEMVPLAARGGLATAVDVYCDEGAFTRAETERVLRAALSAGLHARAHVGQFADLGGAELLADLGGLSADHLEEVSPDGIRALAAAGVVAVMLPSACVQLRQTPPPVAALRAAGVALAVATDMNPGSSMCETLPVPMWLATTHYGMTVAETWLGVTKLAARALGRHDLGVLEVGAPADLVLWDCDDPAAVPYQCGRNLAHTVFKAGRAHRGRDGALV